MPASCTFRVVPVPLRHLIDVDEMQPGPVSRAAFQVPDLDGTETSTYTCPCRECKYGGLASGQIRDIITRC